MIKFRAFALKKIIFGLILFFSLVSPVYAGSINVSITPTSGPQGTNFSINVGGVCGDNFERNLRLNFPSGCSLDNPNTSRLTNGCPDWNWKYDCTAPSNTGTITYSATSDGGQTKSATFTVTGGSTSGGCFDFGHLPTFLQGIQIPNPPCNLLQFIWDHRPDLDQNAGVHDHAQSAGIPAATLWWAYWNPPCGSWDTSSHCGDHNFYGGHPDDLGTLLSRYAASLGFNPSSPTTPPTSAPTAPPTAGPAGVASTSFYKIAENPADLDNDTISPWKTYTSDAGGKMDIPFSFSNGNVGQKFIWVQYQFSDGTKSSKISKSINFVGPDPKITGCSPTLDSTVGNVLFDIQGMHFGATQGTSKLTANNASATITDWGDTAIKAKLTGVSSAGDQQFAVTFTRSDGATDTIPSSGCKLNVSQISLGTNLFCRGPNQSSISNVDVTIVENVVGATPSRETITIDKDGNILGLKTKLQEAHQYKIAVKVPKSLRKVVAITAVRGTTIVPDLSLPIGDISPVSGDGQINSGDVVELIHQWRLISGGSARTADLNGDGLVNSVDFTCQKLSAGVKEDPEPVGVTLPTTPAPTPLICQQDVKTCPDGSFVSRDPNNNCQFKACPL